MRASLSPADVAERAEHVAPKLREHLPPTPFVRFGAFSDELHVVSALR